MLLACMGYYIGVIKNMQSLICYFLYKFSLLEKLRNFMYNEGAFKKKYIFVD